MTQTRGERLYNLLPAIYRIRDTERGEPLRALLAIIEREYKRLEGDIDGLYDDWFIETCAEWVVPYIGDLLGVRPLHSVEGAGLFSQRAYVANTLRLRRRKGTAAVLEQLGRDVTGWPTRAVEYFERLITQQHLNHLRPRNRATVDLRDGNSLALLGGPFETDSHTLEVRRIASERGRYNVPNIGLFLWRLASHLVQQGTPRPVTDPADGRYRFSPWGNDVPLFNRPRTETDIADLAEEIHVPGPLRRRALYDDLEALRQARVDGRPPRRSRFLSEENPSFQISVQDDEGTWTVIPAEEILICDLGDVPGETDWRRPPQVKPYTSHTIMDHSVDPPVPLTDTLPIRVAVDPKLGRLAFPAGVIPKKVAVSYAYGFSGDIGGGPYERREDVTIKTEGQPLALTIAQHDSKADHATLSGALAAWAADGDKDGVITVTDSGTYREAITITMAGQRNLVIQAANERRPTLRPLIGTTELADMVVSGGDGTATLTLSGLWIEGGLRIAANGLEQLILDHCTLVPGRGLDAASAPRRPEMPSLTVESPNSDLRVVIRRSITGPLRLPEKIAELIVHDSIIDSPLPDGPALAGDDAGAAPGPRTTLERVTVFGSVHVVAFELASETIFTGPAVASRRQVGCTRFCFLPAGSRVPGRFRCQPDLALEQYAGKTKGGSIDTLTAAEKEALRTRLTPSFTSMRYGAPGYAQLSRTCAEAIRTGAEDGAEMGAFQHLKQPQREANLRAVLTEYLPFGLDAGLLYVT